MGNTPSSSSSADVPSQCISTSRNGKTVGSGKNINDGDGISDGYNGSAFRLPLYRGERNAFLPTDHSTNDNDVDLDIQPPILSVETKTSNVALSDEPEISPLSGIRDFAGNSATDSVGRPSPQFQLDDHSSRESSPPTVTSSSCDSSYGTCSSTLTSLQTFRWGNADKEKCNESYGQSGWVNSVHQGQDNAGYHQKQFSTTNATQNTLPVSHPNSIRKSSNSNSGIFDCVKPKIVATLPLPSTQTAASEQSMTRRNDISTASLTSLFESCIRVQDDDENEYTKKDDISSGLVIHQRSGSIGSVTSRASVSSHDSCYRNTKSNHTSKASLISAFSATSQTSFYTEQEKNMVDGDEPTYESDLGRVRNYHVVTTAALPWMTGTAVNPLLRAAHLLRRNKELQERQYDDDDQELSEGQHITAESVDQKFGSLESAKRKERNTNLFASPPPGEMTSTDFCQHNKRSYLDIETFGVIEYSDDNSMASQDGQESRSPCSLDYSEHSFFPGAKERCFQSPLGADGDETLPIRRFQPTDRINDGRNKAGQVTLVVPWLTEAKERQKLYGTTINCSNHENPTCEIVEKNNQPIFANKEEQELFIRSWLSKDAGMPVEARELNIIFYPARYHKYYNSIFALGDICDLIPNDSADVCILEEPEHLNWYRAPGCTSWRDKFCYCFGIIHTNYKAYARDHAPVGFLAAPLLVGLNSLVVQANCHRVVKLSDVLQEFAPMSECIENVHGIRHAYLLEGERRTVSMLAIAGSTKQRRAYFIGKLLWAKGFDQLLDLQSAFRERTGDYFEVDVFGSGPDECEIKRAFSGDVTRSGGANEVSRRIFMRLNTWVGEVGSTNKHRGCIPVNFMGKSDHLSLAGDDYCIFVNPSITEVLCTTTAEAIAMGKWAIIPSHPSNAFFVQFPNCLPYRNRREFVSTMKYAMANDPPPLLSDLVQLLSWEAATTRCVKSAAISKRDAARKERLCKVEKTLKNTLSGLWDWRSEVDLL